MTNARHLHSLPSSAPATRCTPRCAGLCSDAGMAAAMSTERGLLHWRAQQSLGDHGLAEHAVQETFLRAWRACATFDDRAGTVRAWLLTILRNQVIDIVRRRASRPAETALDTAPPQVDDSDFVAGLADSWYVTELLDLLPPAQRNAVVEVVLRDRPYQDVAEEISVPVGTLKSRVHYGLRTLRGHVDAPAA